MQKSENVRENIQEVQKSSSVYKTIEKQKYHQMIKKIQMKIKEKKLELISLKQSR